MPRACTTAASEAVTRVVREAAREAARCGTHRRGSTIEPSIAPRPPADALGAGWLVERCSERDATRRLALALAALLFLPAGCNTQEKWTSPLDPARLYRVSPARRTLTVAVLPFKEARPVTNQSATAALSLVPLVPFGWVTSQRPEAAQRFNTTREADLLLQGTAKDTTYYGRILSYGLSFAGPVLWVLGLPVGTSTNTLEISLSLGDAKGYELWSYRYRGEASITQGYYDNSGSDAENFAALMESAMNHALQDLAPKLPEIEQALHQPSD